MSPRPKVDHLRKPQIVAAAAEVLYERGLFDTRIGDIAERAGTSSPTILYYFESKDRLLEEAVDHADREFYERLSEGQERHRARQRQARAPDRGDQPRPGRAERLHAVDGDLGPGPPRPDRPRDRTSGSTAASATLIADIVREGQKDGEFSADADPDDFALALSGLIDGLGVQVTLGQPDVTPARMVDRCLALASASSAAICVG